METTETTQPSLDGLGVSDGFSVSGDTGASSDFVIVTDPAAGPEATINERWYRLYSHSKAMCELMVAFNTELEPGYAPQGLGVAVHDQLSKLENLVTAARILITPAVAATGEWKREGAPNPERWFAGKTGKSPAKARAEMETGKNLGNAPGTREAFKNGGLSAEQADTIADAVEANPEAEQALLDAAKEASLKELKDEAARRKAEVEDVEEREKKIHKRRYVRTWTDSHGAWNLQAKGTIPDGADFMSVLERLIDQQFKQARKAGIRGTRDNYAFDALMNMGAQHEFGNAGPADPGPTGRGPTDPGPADQGPTNPRASGTGFTDPGPTGFDPNDLGPTEPGPTGFGPNDAGPASRGPTGRTSGTGSATGQHEPADRKPTQRQPEAKEPAQHEPNTTGPTGPTASGAKPGPVPAPTPRSRASSGDTGSSQHPQGRQTPLSNGARATANTGHGGPIPESPAAKEPAIDPTPQPGLPLRFAEHGCEGDTTVDGSGPANLSNPRRATRPARPPISQNQIFCIDWAALVRGSARTGERCELRGSGPVSVTAVRRALATSAAKLVVTNEAGRVVTVAHLGTGSINLRLVPGLTDTTRKSPSQPETGAGLAQSKIVIIGVRETDLVELPRSEADESRHMMRVAGVGDVSSDRARSLLGKEATERLAARATAVRSLTHTGRAPSTAQRIALAWLDTTCKVTGCPNQRIEIDHRNPWAAERVTELDNLDPLCAHHHDLKTNHGWQFIHPASNSFVPPEHADHPRSANRTGSAG